MIKPLPTDLMGKLLNVGDTVITPLGHGTVMMVHGKITKLLGWRVIVSASYVDYGEVVKVTLDRYCEGVYKI